jgi:DNA-binding response OmpR family regulator
MPNPKILIVDDEPVIRRFLTRVLEDAEYDVQVASNGQAALEALQQEHFDLLLTDIKMDRMNGVELLRAARDLDDELAIILLTGHATIDSAVEAIRHGAVNYLLKPVKNDELVDAIAAGLQRRAREQRRNRLETLAFEFASTVQIIPERSASSIITCGSITFDTDAYQVFAGEQPLDLTPTEFRLLLTLCEGNGRAFTYTELVQSACGYHCTRQEAREIIGTHVRNLRRKLEAQASAINEIESVRSVGYRLNTDV